MSKERRITSVTVRFNKEVLPFQHVRIEATASITKNDDADSVKEELVAYLEGMSDTIESRIYRKQLDKKLREAQEQEEKKKDDVPY